MTDQEAKRRKIKFEAVLFEFMEPLVLLYKAGRSFYIASALPSDSGFVQEYLVVSATPKYLKRYFREEFDLRYLFASAQHRKFFKMDSAQISKATASVVEFNDDVSEEMLPAPQFFASSHSGKYGEFSSKHDALESLLIDGNWEMEDFGTFSSRYRDIYSFEHSLLRLADKSTPAIEADKIRNAFKNHSLRGGGSYVNLFRDLVNVTPANDQFELKRVQYASPGKIELNGNGQIFDLVEKRIKSVVSDGKRLHRLYWNLYSFMSEKGLLDVSKAAPKVRNAELQKIDSKTQELLSALNLEIYSEIKALSEHNEVNAAKISLAIYRRLKSASSYFAEGRAMYEV